MKNWGRGTGALSRTGGAVHGELLLSTHSAASERGFPAVTQTSRLLRLLSQQKFQQVVFGMLPPNAGAGLILNPQETILQQMTWSPLTA